MVREAVVVSATHGRLLYLLIHCTQGGWLDTLDIDILFTIHIDIL